MTKEELAKYNGKNGQKTYVAVNGKVYDVGTSPLWKEGDHQGVHEAGNDLTDDLKSAPHVRAVVERFPVIDHLEQPEPPKKKKWGMF